MRAAGLVRDDTELLQSEELPVMRAPPKAPVKEEDDKPLFQKLEMVETTA